MFENALNRVLSGTKTLEGKVIAVLLCASLALMGWNVIAIRNAFATDEEEIPVQNEAVEARAQAENGQSASSEQVEAVSIQQQAREQADETQQPASDAPEEDATQPAADQDNQQQQPAQQADEAANEQAPSRESASAESALSESSSAEAADAAEKDEKEEDEGEEYPAVTFPTSYANGVAVNVSAPEGAFPEGTQMRVAPVASSNVIDAVNGVVPGEVSQANVLAVDITFIYDDPKEGPREVEPRVPIQVSLSAQLIAEAESNNEQEAVVVHVDDYNNATVVAQDYGSTGASEISFTAEEFSVYAIAITGDNARLTVKFKVGKTEVESLVVKRADIPNLGELIYDPGVGGLDEGVTFHGWTTEGDYNGDTTAYTIAGVRDDVAERLTAGVSDGDVLTYHAMLFRACYVTYQDEMGVTISTAEAMTPSDGQSEPSYTIDMPYTPKNQDAEFQGWSVVTATADGQVVSDLVYQNGDTINLTGTLTLRAYAPEGHWLSFNENGRGATYTAPQFIKVGDVTAKPSEPTRFGYTFGGWYYDESCRTEFAFGREINERTDVYAKWTPVKTASYTVIIWKQNVAGDGYDFEESISLSGNVGSKVLTIKQSGSGTSAYAQVNGVNKKYTGFHLNTYDTNVVIEPEGTSVANVYYDRNEITFTFYTYNWGWKEYQSMKGLFGSTLVSNGYTWPEEYWWYSDYSGSNGSGTRTTFLDAFLPVGNVTTEKFYAKSNTSGKATITFYKETADGSYEVANKVTSGSGSFNISDKYDGFYAYEYSVDGGNYKTAGTKDSSGYYAKSVSYSKSLEIRFKRNTYDINFMDGVYVDGNGTVIQDQAARGQLEEAADITYGADISSYAKGGADYVEPSYPGYVFAGWYSDDACTQPYDFKTMPSASVTVYAKWVQVQYRVFLHPNVPATDESLAWGQTGQQMSFRISYGDKISNVTGERGDYELIGWYTDEACTKPFNFNVFSLNEATVSTAYDTSLATELDRFGNATSEANADVERFWITKQFDLYAKWRSKLEGAEGIKVSYDAADGTGAPSDEKLYSDQSSATAGAATVPNDPTKQFGYWVVQRYVDGGFVDTDVRVLPGSTFTVLKDDAQVTEAADSTDDDPRYDYTVVLRAVYENTEASSTTFIKYDANGGSFSPGTATTVDDLDVNASVQLLDESSVTRDGYVFKGWSLTGGEDNAAVFKPGQYVYADNNDSEGNSSSNTLYAVWQPIIEIEITGASDSLAYNGSDQAVEGFTVTYRIAGGEALDEAPAGVNVAVAAGKQARATGRDVGTYAMGLEASTFDITVPSGSYYYEQAKGLDIKDGSLEITRLAATVKAVDAGKVYGAGDPELTYEVGGLAEGDDASTIVATVTRAEGEDVGEYAITATGESAQGNYDVTFEGATFTITAAAADGIGLSATGYNGVYDGESHAASADVEIGGTTISYSVDAGETWLSEAPAIKDVGSQTVTVRATNPNYEAAYKTVELSVEPKPALVTAKAASKVYGTVDPTLEATVDGLIEGDSIEYTVARAGGEEVGQYAISPSGDDAQGNYLVKYADATFTITKASGEAVDLTANGFYGVYDGEAHAVTANVAVESGTTIEFSSDRGATWSADAPSRTDVGMARVMVRATNPNYETATAEATIEIIRKPVTVTASDATKVYGDEDPAFEAAVEGVVGNDEVSYAIGRASGEDVATYAITPQGLGEQGNYAVSFVAGSFTITRAPVTVSVHDASKVYGTADPTFTASVSGLKLGDSVATISYNLTRVAGEAVGGYPVNATGDAVQGNYDVTFEPAELAITKAEAGLIGLDAQGYTGIYDGSFHAATATALVLEGTTIEFEGDDGSWSENAPSIRDVGTRDVKVRATNPNYEDATATVKLTVTQRSATVTANSASKTYGTGDPELSASVEGTVKGDSVVYTVTRGQGEDAGNYPITAVGDESQGNYLVTFKDAVFSIFAAPSAGIGLEATGYSSVYDGQSHAVSASASIEAGTKIEYSTDGENWSAEAPSITNVGEQIVSVRATNANYETASTQVKLEIKPKAVLVAAASATKVYGEDDPELTATVQGTIGEDKVSYTVARAAGEGVGEYTITASGEEVQGNYTVSYEPAIFTITKAGEAALALTATGYSGVYDGESHAVTATTQVPNGTNIEFQVEGGEWTPVAPTITDVGETIVQVRAVNENYLTASTSVKLVVTPKDVTVKAVNAGKVYGTEDPELKAEVMGTIGSDTVAYSVARVEGEDVGAYAIDVMGEASQGNYAVSYEGGSFDITPAPAQDLGLSATGYTGVYDGKAHAAEAEAKVEGSTVEYSVDGGDWTDVAPTIADVGEREVSVRATNPNYLTATENVTLKVTQKPVTVKAVDAAKVYGTSDPAFEVSVSGTVGDDAVSYALARAQGEDVGTYPVTPSGEASQGNYAVTFVDGALTITRAQAVVSANDGVKVFGSADPALSATVSGLENGDESLVVAYALERAKGENVGSYVISVSGEAIQGNYDVTYTPATFEITPAPAGLMGLSATGFEGVYDGEFHAVTTSVDDEAGTVVEFETGDGNWSRTPPAIRDVGETVVNVRAVNANYETATATATLKVTPRPALVTAISASKVYGDRDPIMRADVTGVLDGEEVSYSLTRAEGEDVGTYDIVAAGDASQGNYAIEYANATFNITRASGESLDLSAFGYTGVYDGESHQAKASVGVEEETTIEYSTDGGATWSSEPPAIVDVGEIHVMVRATNPNYETATAEAMLRATAKSVTVKASNASKTYGDEDPVFTAEVTGTVGNDTVSYDIDREAGQTVGSYAIMPYGEAVQGNYAVSYEDATLQITRATATVTADGKSKVYGTEDPNLTAVVSGLRSGDDENVIAYSVDRSAGENVGTYDIVATGDAVQGNYDVVFVPSVLTIGKADGGLLGLDVSGYDGLYDAELHAASAVADVADGTTIEYRVEGGDWSLTPPSIRDVGRTSFEVRASNRNYEQAHAEGTLVVAQRPVSVSANAGSKIFGSSDPALTATVNGTLGSDSVDYRIGRAEGENVGTYPINVTGAQSQGNYTVSFADSVFTISAAPAVDLGLEVSGFEGVYDGREHFVTAHTGVSSGSIVEYSVDEGSWTTTVPSITNVGTVSVHVRVTNPNYATAYADTVLSVTPKTVTVAAEGKAKVYGEDDPALTAVVNGLVGSDEVEYELSRAEGEDVGTYAIEATGNSSQGNYIVEFLPAQLEIAPAGEEALSLTAVGYSGVYDGESHAASAVAGVTQGTIIEYRIGDGEWSTVAPSITDVGEIAVEVRAVNSNYLTATASTTLKVTQRQVSVVPKSYAKIYGQEDPTFEADVEGLVGEDEVAFELAREIGENVGTYVISSTGEESQGNYAVAFRDGVLAISAAPASALGLEAQGYEGVYDAQSHAVTASSTVDDAIVEYSVDGDTWSPEAPSITDVGQRAVQVRAVHPNYSSATTSTVLTIAPKPVSVTANGQSKVYGEEDPAFDASVDGLLGDDSVEYAIERKAGENVGSYLIAPTGETLQGNYRVSYEPALLNITRAVATVSALDASKVYGDQDPALRATVTGLANGDSANVITYELARLAGEDVGIYAITALGDIVQGNYEVVFERAQLEITRAPAAQIGLTATGYEGVYDGLSHAVEASSSVADGTVIEYRVDGGEWTQVAPSIKDVGSISVEIRAVNPNYEVAEATATLSIARKQAVVTAESKAKVYGEEDPSLTAIVDGVVTGDSVDYALDRAAGEDAGTYAITATGSAVQGNYDVSYVPGMLAIAPAGQEALALTALGYSGVYDGLDHAASARVSVVEGTTIEYSVDGSTWSSDASSIRDAGSQVVQVRASNKNYETAYAEATLSVAKRPVTVSAVNVSKVYGEVDPDLSAIVAGVVGEDSVEYELARTEGESVGSYEVSANVEEDQGNYTVKGISGELAITPAHLSVAAEDKQKVYGQADPSLTAQPEGLVAGDEVQVINFSLERAAGENAGTYAISVVGEREQGNYIVSYEPAVMTIDRAQATVAAEQKAKVYGQEDPAFTAVVSGLANDDDDGVISYSFGRSSGEDVGTYEIVPTGDAAQGNYLVEFVTSSLTVTPASVSIVTPSASKPYDGTPLTAPGTIEGILNGETYTFETVGSQVEVGTSDNAYRLEWNGTAVESNYQLSNVSVGKLEVTDALAEPHMLVVRFVYEDGDIAAAPVAEEHDAGVAFEVELPVIEGYSAIDAGGLPIAGKLTGVMPDQDVEITVTYMAIAGIAPPATGEQAQTSTQSPATPVAAGSQAAAPADEVDSTSYVENAAEAEVLIGDDGVPVVRSIDSDEVALAQGSANRTWSLFDLIATVITALMALFMIVALLANRKRDDEETEEEESVETEGEQAESENVKRHRIMRIASIVPAIVAIILFALTQDLSAKMTIFDLWSIAFAIIGIVNVALLIASRTTTDDDEIDDQQS